MDVIKVINEVINEMLSYNGEINLEDAQRYYGTLVSWLLDDKDLKIINRMRVKYLKDKEKINYYNRESEISQLWDNHMRQTKEALWHNAQK